VFIGKQRTEGAMPRKNITWILLYFVIALLFILGALFKTISDDPIVVTMQWFGAVVFAGLGILKLIKGKTTAD
jgi:hypothetical protein